MVSTERLMTPEMLSKMAGGPATPEEMALIGPETEVEIPDEDAGENGEEDSFEQEPELEEEMVPHDANLAEFLEDEDLVGIATELLQKVEADIQSRKDWIRTYEDGLGYLGFSQEERSEPFEGASGVFHPIMSEAVVRFQSNAIMEVFPAAGPVTIRNYGNEDEERVAQGKRVKEELNYQLTENMPEYRKEMEQLLFRLPLSGSVFKKVYYDELKQRPCAMMVRGEDFIIDDATSDLDSSERYTHVLKKSHNEIKKLQRSGFYRKCDLPEPTQEFKDAEEKELKLMGNRPSLETDDRHTLYEIHVHYNLPEPFDDDDGIADPYIITIDKQSQKVLAIYRNWEEGDDQLRKPVQYFVHYQYMPGLGFYGVGLVHLLGSIAKASTSILRQLIDAGTFSNLPGGLKTKGLRTTGENVPIAPGEWRDVDVPAGSIRDNLFPLPYKEPSAVLAQLLASIVEEGRRIGSIADVEIGSMSEQSPVGTTLALLERSLKVMSAVHARLHASLKKELGLIAKVIFDYMPKNYDWDLEGRFDRKRDFDGRVDVVPVSDPNAATQSQKIVQLQAVMQLASQNPEIYNLKELHREGLHAIGIKDPEKLIPLDQEPPRMDPIQENMALLIMQPVKVFQDQNHSAHIQAHVSAMTDPKLREMVGQSQNAPKVMAAFEAHIAEHLAFEYRDEVTKVMGQPLPQPGQKLPPQVEAQIALLTAQASDQVKQQHTKEVASKNAQEVIEDPVFRLKLRELEIREKELALKQKQMELDAQIEREKIAAKLTSDDKRLESEEARAAQTVGANLITFGVGLEKEERMQAMELAEQAEDSIRNDLTRRREIMAKERVDAIKAAQKPKGPSKE